MRIKILEVYGGEHCECCGNYPREILSHTDGWHEVSEEEYDTLLKWAKKNNGDYYNEKKIVIVAEKDINIPKTVKDYLEKINEENKAAEEKLKKQQEKQQKAAATRQKKTEEEEKKLLEELQNKYRK